MLSRKKKYVFFTTNKKSSHFLQLEERKNEKILFWSFCFKFLELLLEGCCFFTMILHKCRRCHNIVTSFFWSGTSPSSVYKISILTFLILCTKFLFHIFFLQLLGYLRSDRLNHHDLFLSAEEEPELVDHHLNDVLEVRPHGFEFPQIAELVL